MISAFLLLASTKCLQPVPVDKAEMTSDYGHRLGVHDHVHFHKGIDLQAKEGTPIRAIARGRIEYAGLGPLGGNTVVIRVSSNSRKQLLVLHGHLKDILVQEGKLVFPGDIIGTVGDTGNSTAPHLHFAVYVHDRDKGTKKHVDPYSKLNLCKYKILMNKHF